LFVLLHVHSCAYQMEWSLFQDSEQTIHGAKINDTSYESRADFHWEKIFLKNPKLKYQIKKCHFTVRPISYLKFRNNFYNLKHANLERLTPSASRWLNR
jgi:hypothetical protein